jgi:hypothetical protein
VTNPSSDIVIPPSTFAMRLLSSMYRGWLYVT